MEGREGEAGNDVKSNPPFSLGGGETLIRMKTWFNEDENGNCAGQPSPYAATFPGGLAGSLRGWDTGMGMGEEDLGQGRDAVGPQFPLRGSSQVLCRAPLDPEAGSRCLRPSFFIPHLVLNNNTANSGIEIVMLFIYYMSGTVPTPYKC